VRYVRRHERPGKALGVDASHRWLALYISWGKIMLRSAPALAGPWSDELEVFEPPEADALHALAHPEFQERRGKAEYVSYLAQNHFHLLRVELTRP
jgi:hypothetical protein